MNKKPRILVADDDPQIVNLIKAQLLKQGYEILTAPDGTKALQLALTEKIDLLLTDVQMPGLNGFEITQKIRENETTRALPVLMVAGLADTENRIKGLEAGCDDFISKPFDLTELLARVKSLLRINYYRSLLDEKEKFEYVLHNMNDGLVLMDKDFKILQANRKASDWLMLPSPPAAVNLPEHLLRAFTLQLEEDLKTAIIRQPLSFDLVRQETETERPLILAARSSVAQNPLGEITSVVILLTDVTEIRNNQYAEHAFLTMISHKLRTPMSVIDGYMGMLQDGTLGSLSAEQKQAIDVLVAKSRELIDSYEKQLVYLQLGKAKPRPPASGIALQNYLDTIPKGLAAFLAKMSGGREVKVRVIPGDLGPGVSLRVEEEHLHLILKNLLENAVKFDTHPVVEVDIQVQASPQNARFSVSDHGSGIPPEEKEKIFEPFYQVDKHRTGNVSGTGMGLAVVKRVVNLCGGTLEVQSEIGRGSIFTFTLPIMPLAVLSDKSAHEKKPS